MHIDRENNRGRVTAVGCMEPEHAAELAASAMAEARAAHVGTLLLNFKDASLSRGMSVTECHHVGERLALAGRGLEKIALVTRLDCLEPNAFVFTVARNRGLHLEPFEHESEAVRWLQAA